MKLELTPERFDCGVGDFDIGHVLRDTEGNPEIEIVKFSGYTEIDDADGTEHETIIVHFSDQSTIDFEDLERAVFIKRTFHPIAPDWFVVEVNGDAEDAEAQAEIEAQRKAKIEAERAALRLQTEIKTKIPSRPIDAYTDQELMAKVSGAPLGVAEDVLISYEGNLARMAGSSAKQMQRISGIGSVRSEKIIAAFELGKRLARFHAEKEKNHCACRCRRPDDVKNAVSSRRKSLLRAWHLDTKGGVTSDRQSGRNCRVT